MNDPTSPILAGRGTHSIPAGAWSSSLNAPTGKVSSSQSTARSVGHDDPREPEAVVEALAWAHGVRRPSFTASVACGATVTGATAAGLESKYGQASRGLHPG